MVTVVRTKTYKAGTLGVREPVSHRETGASRRGTRNLSLHGVPEIDASNWRVASP